ncbi:hypothetical protein [Longimicrobium sp.]|jgi:hypothetical protein|uniref:hypothetical protein n=1 Tax=Longimicrobium sp. TaxID=2029185 RepID=UPI002EDA9B8C
MRGIVRIINDNSGLAAVELDVDDWTIFEPLGASDADLDDVVTGNLTSLGSNTWINETRHQRFSVYVQDIHASAEVALRTVRGF